MDLACSGPLAGLKCSLGGRKWCDAGLRPLWAGSTGMQRFDAASCQPVSIEGCRISCAVGSGLRSADLPGYDGLLGTAVLVQRWDEILGPAVGKAEPFFGFVEVLGLSVSDAGVVHGAGREKITKPYSFKRENPQNYTPLPLYTKVACMIHGMLQYMVQEYLFRIIVRGGVQSDTGFICEALPGALKENILIGKGLLNKIACMIYGRVQSMVQDYLFRSIVRGAVQPKTDLICEALPGALEENIFICKGLFTKAACKTYSTLQNMDQEYLFRSFGRGAVQSEADFFCEAVPGALEENIVLGKGFFTKVASMIYGMSQNMVQEYLFRSIVRGTVQPETNFICEALPGALKENIFICKGLFTKAACKTYSTLQNIDQE